MQPDKGLSIDFLSKN